MSKLKDTQVNGSLNVSGNITSANIVSENITSDNIVTMQNQIDELNSNLETKIPFNLDWIFIDGDLMQAIRPYCMSGKSYFVIFQTGGSATNTGKVPIYALGTLITNGINRHCITANARATGADFHITGTNNNDTYSEDGWAWYGFQNNSLS